MRSFISRAALLVNVTARIWMTLGPAHGHDVGNARREHPGFAGAGAGQNQNRAIQSLDGGALLRVEPLEICRPHAGRPRPRRNGRCRGSARGRRSLRQAPAKPALVADRTAANHRRLPPRCRATCSTHALILRHEIGL